jgi:nitroimidazol reductase NimA-like FMN-containing flavoprotein (pyridoxamine 5'-phosphate oxidase superfamily)
MIPMKTSKRLSSARIAWFSTVRTDGSPHTVPVWFVHDEDNLWVASPASSRKIANVRQNDRVTLAVDGSAPESLVAMGRAEIIETFDDRWFATGAFARKYDGFDITAVSVAGPLVLMRIVITRWLLDGSPQ